MELWNEQEFARRYGKRLAVVVPYRNRAEHLAQFVPRILRYFERDKLDKHIAVTVHIVEQRGTAIFNRGKIKNCGYALAKDTCDYVCFHDVDYLPIWADYSWQERPCRLVGYGLQRNEDPETFFGAVVLFDKAAFESVNGYSNLYWGWGFEDAELGLRCRHVLGGFDDRNGTFRRLPHVSDGLVKPGVFNEEALRTRALYHSRLPELGKWLDADGLSSLDFTLIERSPFILDGVPVPNVFHYRVGIGHPDF